MRLIDQTDRERLYHYAKNLSGSRCADLFSRAREDVESYYVSRADSPGAMVNDIERFDLNSLADYLERFRELWNNGKYAQVETLKRIVIAASLKSAPKRNRIMLGEIPGAADAEELNVAVATLKRSLGYILGPRENDAAPSVVQNTDAQKALSKSVEKSLNEQLPASIYTL